MLRHTRDPYFVSREIKSALSPDGVYLATNLPYSGDGLSVRALRSDEVTFRFSHTWDDVMTPAFSQDGKLLAVSVRDSRANPFRVHVLRPDSGEELFAFAAEKMTPTGVAIDPSGKRLAVALTPRGDSDGQGSLVTWRIDHNKEDPVFKKVTLPALATRSHRSIHTPLVYSPDGSLLARIVLGDFRQSVQLYDAFTGEDRLSLFVHRMVTTAPAFSPDSRTLAVASGGYTLDHYVSLWELRTGKVRWYGPLPATPTALAFAPSGKLLATGHGDSSALVWDVTGHYATAKVRTAAEYGDLWRTLASDDASKAFTAQQSLASGDDDAVAALRKKLKPAVGKSLDDATLAKLVQQLDDDDPDTRQKARVALEQQGRAAQAVLRKALQGNPSVEVKRSARVLLTRITKATVAGEELAALRAVEVLKWVGTPAARQLIEELAHGWAAAELTRDAKATLARLRR
jgi:dipeptidyl aminopeptidase/acylaminoacyl peptidase